MSTVAKQVVYNQHAFTFKEVMITIFLVGAVLALIFSQYDTHRSRSRDAERIGILSQYGKDLELYAQTIGNKNFPASVPNRCMDVAISMDTRFAFLREGKGGLIQDPKPTHKAILPCPTEGVFYYRTISGLNIFDDVIQEGIVIAARMELATNANYGSSAILEGIKATDFARLEQDRAVGNTIPEKMTDSLYGIIIRNPK